MPLYGQGSAGDCHDPPASIRQLIGAGLNNWPQPRQLKINPKSFYAVKMIFDRLLILASLGSLFFLLLILELIRRRRLDEGYALLWLVSGLLLLGFSVWRKALDYLAALVGIHYPPAALLLLLILGLFLVMIQFSMVISRQRRQIKALTQRLGLLEEKQTRTETISVSGGTRQP